MTQQSQNMSVDVREQHFFKEDLTPLGKLMMRQDQNLNDKTFSKIADDATISMF